MNNRADNICNVCGAVIDDECKFCERAEILDVKLRDNNNWTWK